MENTSEEPPAWANTFRYDMLASVRTCIQAEIHNLRTGVQADIQNLRVVIQDMRTNLAYAEFAQERGKHASADQDFRRVRSPLDIQSLMPSPRTMTDLWERSFKLHAAQDDARERKKDLEADQNAGLFRTRESDNIAIIQEQLNQLRNVFAHLELRTKKLEDAALLNKFETY